LPTHVVRAGFFNIRTGASNLFSKLFLVSPSHRDWRSAQTDSRAARSREDQRAAASHVSAVAEFAAADRLIYFQLCIIHWPQLCCRNKRLTKPGDFGHFPQKSVKHILVSSRTKNSIYANCKNTVQ